MTRQEIKRKTIKSITIVSGCHFLGKTAVVGKNIVLARLLSPEDFGIFAIALVLTDFLRQMLQAGLMEAVVQKEDADDKTIYTGFTISFLYAIIILVIIWFVADLYSGFYQDNRIGMVVKVTGFSFLFIVLGYVPDVILTRQLNFRVKAISELLALICGVIISLILAYRGFGYWSLAWGFVATMSLHRMFLFLANPCKLKIAFDYTTARNLLSFAGHVLLTTILAFLAIKLPDIVVGRILGVGLLGFYAMAFRWASFVTTDVTQILSKVLFPTFSVIQKEPQLIKSGYLKALKYLLLFALPCTFGMVAIAPEFVNVALGQRWELAIVPLQILCFAGLFRAVRMIGSTTRKAIGRPGIINFALSAQLVILAILLWPLTRMFGLVGASFAMSFVVLLVNIPLFYIDMRLFHITIKELADCLKHPFVGSLIMVASLFGIRAFLGQLENTISLFVLILTGVLSYTLYLYKTFPDLIKSVLRLRFLEYLRT